MSACSSIYTVQDEMYDSPPPPKGPAPQAWGNEIPKELQSTTATHLVSGISQDEYDKVSRDNAKLARKVDELTLQVKALLDLNTPVIKMPAPAPLDIQGIIAATTEAVLQAIYAHQRQIEGSEEETPFFPPGEIDPDMSLDSELTERKT
jgi:hypothetical protein